MGVQGIDRELAAGLELSLAGAAGALRNAAADVTDAMRWADVCDDVSGRLRRIVDWLDGEKRDLERRAYLIDVPDGAYGPFLPSMLVLPGPVAPSVDPLDDLF